MRRIAKISAVSALIIFWILISLPAINVHSATIIDSINYKIKLEDFSSYPYSIARLPVQLKNAEAIGGFVLRIEYDTSLLSPVDISPGYLTILYDSLEMTGRGLKTIRIDSSMGIPPWDTIYYVYAIHDSADKIVNVNAVYINFLPAFPPTDPNLLPFWSRPHVPINDGQPTSILYLLFRVREDAPLGQSASVYVKNYTGPYSESRVVQLVDTIGYTSIQPGQGPTYAECSFTVIPASCGDANGDGYIDMVDIMYLIAYLYRNGPAPDPLEYADVNSDYSVDMLDILYLILYRYKNGPEPVCP